MFKITVMPTVERDFLLLMRSATTPESALAIRHAMRSVILKLQSHAANVGEPLYDLKQMKMRICRIVSPPLYIEYGVHISEPKAFIRRVSLIRKPA